MRDADAFEHYDDPANREPVPGPAHRRLDSPLTKHVPVRFQRETIRRVERLADADGVTVSAWIRCAVDEALRQRSR